jgi:hypothetical protein
MRALGGGEQKALKAALMAAFPLPEDLDMLLALRLDRSLAALAPAGRTHEYVVFSVVRASQAEGWTAELILAACAARPRRADLAALAERLGLTAAGGELELERMVRSRAGIHDAGLWREHLRRSERRVCRLDGETPKLAVNGTAFLVGPDLLLTNFHVVEPLLLSVGPVQLRARFDVRRGPDGESVVAGVPFPLADDWMLASSPHADAEQASVEAAGDDPARLDYALLRLGEPVGEQEIGLDGGGDVRRGWVALSAAVQAPEVNDQALILQHPGEAPLQLAIDRIVSVDAERAIVRYLTNTDGGSSGAPCFGSSWELIALHQCGSAGGSSNQGIAACAIAEHIAAKLGPGMLPGGPESA